VCVFRREIETVPCLMDEYTIMLDLDSVSCGRLQSVCVFREEIEAVPF
jgi:hypothetical protein